MTFGIRNCKDAGIRPRRAKTLNGDNDEMIAVVVATAKSTERVELMPPTLSSDARRSGSLGRRKVRDGTKASRYQICPGRLVGGCQGVEGKKGKEGAKQLKYFQEASKAVEHLKLEASPKP